MAGQPRVGLVAIDGTVAREAASPDAAFARELGLETAHVRDLMAGIIAMTPPAMLAAGPWGNFFAFDAATREVIGCCGFKHPPDRSGTVEIAYHTFPPFERRGYATAMAAELVSRARASGRVRRILAHTLAGPSASTRALERAGLALAGEADDPEVGRVWRWQSTVAGAIPSLS